MNLSELHSYDLIILWDVDLLTVLSFRLLSKLWLILFDGEDILIFSKIDSRDKIFTRTDSPSQSLGSSFQTCFNEYSEMTIVQPLLKFMIKIDADIFNDKSSTQHKHEWVNPLQHPTHQYLVIMY